MNYTIYHLHSDFSLLDSATKFYKYVDKTAELGMKSLGFTEHGNIFGWVSKKRKIEEKGMKYIHAQEFYITESLQEKIRDNYHTILIARNYAGVKELNRLSSLAYKRDGHYYYDPRITMEELASTSDNILITTACLASPLNKGRGKSIEEKYIDFLTQNKHRCYLEIQYHATPEQIEYNQRLIVLSQECSIPLIVGTDTHAIDDKYLMARKILLQAKKMSFTDEESYDLRLKSYDEVVGMFEKQGCIDMDTVKQALENTNILADRIDPFELDTSIKYPKLYPNPEAQLKRRVNEGVRERGINSFSPELKKQYFDRLRYEYEVYKKTGSLDYILLVDDVITFAKSQKILHGYGRGSVNGSLVAYVLGITEMDSIKFNLIFERFVNPERVSLCDIDVDYPPSRRDEVKDFLLKKEGVNASNIITFNTVALKGAIKEVCRALKIPLETADEISKNIETQEDMYRKEYPEVFEYADLLNGVNVSVGSHPAGVLVTEHNIEEEIGTFTTTKTSDMPISTCDMDEIDSLNYVKLDVLSLENIEVVNMACELAGIERLTPDNMNFVDDAVWEDIKESGMGIFQMEGRFAHAILAKALNNYGVMKEQSAKMTRLDLMSMINGAIRPAGESFRDLLCNGIFKDNGDKYINEFMGDTMGYLVYQEQILKFLNQFCGYAAGEADVIRRKIGKKKGTEDVIPEVKKRFIATMHSRYGVNADHAAFIVEPFLKVIEDASNYGFSINHSAPYSAIGYACGWLRKHYPLEFITTMLNVFEDKKEKTSDIVQYALQKGVTIESVKFRKSRAGYSCEKSSNSIYKGVASIPHLNARVSEELYSLRDSQYSAFVDLLVDITENTSANSRQIKILIKVNYFSEFGGNEKLLSVYDAFESGEIKYDKKYVAKTKQQRLAALYQFESQQPNTSLSMYDQIALEKEYLGFITSKYLQSPPTYAIIISIEKTFMGKPRSPLVTVYYLQSGREHTYKIPYKDFYRNNDEACDVGDILVVDKVTVEPRKSKLPSGKWVQLEGTSEELIYSPHVLRRKK